MQSIIVRVLAFIHGWDPFFVTICSLLLIKMQIIAIYSLLLCNRVVM